jgi:hypothetical protein
MTVPLYVVRHTTYTTGVFFTDRLEAEAKMRAMIGREEEEALTDRSYYYIKEIAIGDEIDIEDVLDI